MGRWLAAILASLLTACQPEGSRVLGRAPDGIALTIAQLKQARTAGDAAMVAGEVVEKCPVAGCWFVLRDETGAIKVDTKSAGFVVLDVPLRARVRVAGRPVSEGAETLLQATGLRY